MRLPQPAIPGPTALGVAAVALAAIGLASPALADSLGELLTLAADTPAGEYAAGEHGDDHGEVNPLGIFDFNVMHYIWNMLMFLILLGVLMWFVWPAVLKGLREREQKIRTDIQQAQNAREDAEKMKADFEKQLAESRQESQRIIAEATTAAEQRAAQREAEHQRKMDADRERAKAEIASAKEAALADIYAQTATLATEAAAKILGRSLNPDDQRDLVDQTVNKYQAQQN